MDNNNINDSFNIDIIDNSFKLCINIFSIYVIDNLMQYIQQIKVDGIKYIL